MSVTDADTMTTPEPETPGEAIAGAGEAIPVTLVDAAALDGILATLPAAQAAWARTMEFRAAPGKSVCLPDNDGAIARVLVGWEASRGPRSERLPLGGFAGGAPGGTYRLDTELEPHEAELAALSWLLARYRFERYKSGPAGSEAHLLAPDNADGLRISTLAEGVFFTRDLINTPTADMGPEALETQIRRLGERHGAEVTSTVGEALLEANLPLIHTVGRAAAEAPRLVDMRWGPKDAPTVTLVGKGVCFDTGGLDLKPASAMGLMKKDMGGAATVLGLAHMIMALGLNLNLRVLVPAVENSVSANSFRPGDVIRSRKGLTVEVNNTDAEGRLVLADALTLASEEKPGLLIDMATLTGAARVALGVELAPYFTGDDELAQEIERAARNAEDPVWRLPLWPGYERDIEPDIADLDNAPSGGKGGAITAALFLQRFVGECPWVHFDIFAWNQTTRPGRPKGGEAQASRALLALLEARYGRQSG